jgi:hypothetical protein
MKFPLDHYSRNARLLPALIVAIPISTTLAGFGASVSSAVAAVLGAGSALGLTPLLAQLGRDRGKTKEVTLFTLWGGKPSVKKMRHREPSLNSVTRARYIAKAKKLLSIRHWPSSEEEATDPNGADRNYDALTNLLLERTRDTRRFPLVYAELVNYGFRRNLWGLKPIGFLSSIFSLSASVSQLIYQVRVIHRPSTLTISAVLVDLAFLIVWTYWINPDWVRIPAEAYAERLLSSLEKL